MQSLSFQYEKHTISLRILTSHQKIDDVFYSTSIFYVNENARASDLFYRKLLLLE